MEKNKWMTTKEAAKLLDREVSSVSRYYDEGKLTKRRKGKPAYYDKEEILEVKRRIEQGYTFDTVTGEWNE